MTTTEMFDRIKVLFQNYITLVDDTTIEVIVTKYDELDAILFELNLLLRDLEVNHYFYQIMGLTETLRTKASNA